jgi:hypothetical protein
MGRCRRAEPDRISRARVDGHPVVCDVRREVQKVA